MEATCWSDYLCPWCYLGQHRDAIMGELGVQVVHRPYELHPEIGPAGRRVRPGGRLTTTFDRIAEECEAVGLRFRRPDRMPNTRRALATAEWVRVHHGDAFAPLHRALFAAQFVTGDRLDDPAVIDAAVDAAGAPADDARRAVEGGEGLELLDASMAEARLQGISSTPSWLLGDGLVLPGALDPATIERWVRKIQARRGQPAAP